MTDFVVWLEFEELDFAANRSGRQGWNSHNDFCTIHVTLNDGRRYGLNVWTYAFLATAIDYDEESGAQLGGTYQIPPDLLVRELTRECLEATIADLLKRGNLETVLNPSIIDSSLAEDEG